MATDVGIKVKVEGEKTFRTAIQAINQQTKELNAEMKSATAGMAKMGTSEEQISTKTRLLSEIIDKNKEKVAVLSRQYDAAKGRLDQLGQELEEAKAKGADNTKEVQKAENAYNRQAAEVAKLGTQLNQANATIKESEAELKALNAQMSSMGRFASSCEKLGSTFQGAGGKLKNIGTSMTRYVTTPLLAVGAAAVKTTADFDNAMSEVSAISGATGDDLERLRDKAKEMGESTKFTATEAADAMTYMAMAGWKTEQMLSGLPGIMNLAAASGEDLAQVADIVTDGLTAFGLSAQDSAHFADVLAQAGRNSNTNVAMLGESFKYVGSVAGAFGYSIEDVGTALGLMANSGIKSSQAGASLRQALVKLTDPTDKAAALMEQYHISLYNTNGSTKSLMEVMKDLRKEFGGVTVNMEDATEAAEAGDEAWESYAKSLPITEQEKLTALTKIFGARAMPAMLAVINAGEDDFNSLATAISNADGAAEEMAETMLGNLSGQLTLLKSKAEGVAISFGEIMVPKLRSVVDAASDVLDKFKQMSPATQELIIKGAAVSAMAGPVTSALGSMTMGLGHVISAVGSLTSSLAGGAGLAGALTTVFSPAGLVVAGIVAAAGLTVGSIALGKAIHEATDPISNMEKALKGATQAQDEMAQNSSILELTEKYESLRAKTQDASLSEEELKQARQELRTVTEQLSEVTNGQVSATEDASRATDTQVAATKELAEVERKRAELEIYSELLKGADNYQEAMLDQKRLEVELADATEHMTDAYNAMGKDVEAQMDSLRDSVANTRQELEDGLIDTSTVEGAEALNKKLRELEDQVNSLSTTGEKVHFDSLAEAEAYIDQMSVSTGDMADVAADAAKQYGVLSEEMQKSKQTTDRYRETVLTAVKSGLIPASHGAQVLGISVRELNQALKGTADGTKNAGTAAGEMGTASDGAAQSVDGMTGAMEGVPGAAGSAAEGLDAAADSTDQATVSAEELKKNYGTLQTAMQEMGIGTKESLTEIVAYLSTTEVSAEQFASGVQAARDNVVNSFKTIRDENAMTAAEMTEVLADNLQVQREWGSNLATLWNQTQDATVRAYINYLYEQGPTYASAVAEFANGGQAALEEQAYLWASAADLATDQYAAHIYAQQWLTGEAARELGQGAVDTLTEYAQNYGQAGAEGADQYSQALGDQGAANGGKQLGESAVEGLKSTQGDFQTAAKTMTSGAESAITSAAPRFKEAGTQLGTMLVTGYRAQLSTARAAATNMAAVMAAAITAKMATFRTAGTTVGTQVASGLNSQTQAARAAGAALAQGGISGAAGLAPEFREAGYNAGSGYVGGIRAGADGAWSAGRAAANDALKGASIGGWYSVGYNMAAGIASGVSGGSYLIASAARSAARSALYAAKATLGIHSPSRVFRDQVGSMIGAGMAEGILAERKTVNQAVEQLGMAPIRAVSSRMGGATWDRHQTNMATYGDTIINMTVNAVAGQSVQELADAVERRITMRMRREAAARA